MEKRLLGKTDISVTLLGYDGAEVGFQNESVDTVSRLLNAALDAGLNTIDTAECYNASEALIGEAVSHRRGEYHLFTKCGHASGIETPCTVNALNFTTAPSSVGVTKPSMPARTRLDGPRRYRFQLSAPFARPCRPGRLDRGSTPPLRVRRRAGPQAIGERDRGPAAFVFASSILSPQEAARGFITMA